MVLSEATTSQYFWSCLTAFLKHPSAFILLHFAHTMYNIYILDDLIGYTVDNVSVYVWIRYSRCR